MQRFDATAARRNEDGQAAALLLRAMVVGGTHPRLAAKALPFNGYDADALFDAASPSALRARVTKAAVAASEFPLEAGPLRYVMSEIRAASVLRLLDRAVRIPFVRSAGVQVLGVTAGFVGEGQSRVVQRSEFTPIAHPLRGVGALVVASAEGVRDQPGAEVLLRNELIRAGAAAIDAKFASADAVSSIAPAGIAENATAVSSTGATAAAVSTDLAAMVDVLADSSLAAPVWLLSPKAHAFLQLLGVTNDAGDRIAGFPVHSSSAISRILLLASDRLALSLSDEVALVASREGDVEMSDDPENEAGTRVSLFQTNSVALALNAYANWSLRAPEVTAGSKGVVELTGASYV